MQKETKMEKPKARNCNVFGKYVSTPIACYEFRYFADKSPFPSVENCALNSYV
jgi:hypothetical protein